MIMVENMILQLRDWLTYPVMQGERLHAQRLMARCRQVARLHPTSNPVLLKALMSRAEENLSLVSARARTEYDMDALYPGVGVVGTMLVSAGTISAGLGFGFPGVFITGVGVLCLGFSQFGRHAGP